MLTACVVPERAPLPVLSGSGQQQGFTPCQSTQAATTGGAGRSLCVGEGIEPLKTVLGGGFGKKGSN